LYADIPALRTSGVGLGISTHTDWEIARARFFEPSYIAFGPVFPPLSKKLRYPPLGIDRLTVWSKRYKAWPRTCIGGIVPDNVAAVAATGVGSFALVTCIAGGPADERRIAETLQTLRNALDASQSGRDKID
jgi:hydroxymethylpyrimidine kinase/phosphomethylpyrimidine kinase/thiamine-phosphate diphosphorylase